MIYTVLNIKNTFYSKNIKVKIMNDETYQIGIGILSIIIGILGLVSYFIGFFFFSFVDNRLYGMIIGFIMGIIAIILGYIAKKKEDKYGIYGIYIGMIIIIITLITISLTTIVSVETGTY
jgi:hypothetical protein